MTAEAKWDAIVIGGGLAGLTAGAYLTVAGQRVLLLEYGEVVGGTTQVFRRKGGWEFDVGVHHLGNCGPDGLLPQMLRGLGLGERIEFLPLDPDGFETYRLPGFELRAPWGFEGYQERLIAAFPGDARGIRRFMRVMRGLGGAIDRGRTPASWGGMSAFLLRARQHGAWTMMPLQTLYNFCGLSPEAQLVLSMANLSYMAPPSRAPVGMHAAFLWEFIERGAYYPKGGGQMLAANIADVIRTHGGEIRTRAEVEQILIDGGRAGGVRLRTGEVFHAPAVVSTADIKKTFLDLVGREHLKLRTGRRVQGGRMCLPWFNTYIGIDVDLRQTMTATDHLSFPTWSSFEDVWALLSTPRRRTGAWMDDLAERLPAYIHCSTLKDPENSRFAPPGHTAFEAMVPISGDHRLWGLNGGPATGERYRKNSQYLELKERLTDVMVRRLEEAVPAAKGHVVFREAATPITQERYTIPTGGSAYGLEIATDQFAKIGRYGVRTEIPGLFLAGSSTAWGPGVEGVVHSGVYAAGTVLGRDLATEVRHGAVLGTPSRLTPLTADWDPLAASRRLGERAGAREAVPAAAG